MRRPSRRIGTPRRVRTRLIPGAWALMARQPASACAKNLDCAVLNSYAPDNCAVSWPNRAMVYPLPKPRRGIVIRGELVHLAVRLKDKPLLGGAKPGRVLDQSVENRLKFERRAADHLEHVGGGGLVVQRFTQLVEKPRVLDGDDGLRGEVLN